MIKFKIKERTVFFVVLAIIITSIILISANEGISGGSLELNLTINDSQENQSSMNMTNNALQENLGIVGYIMKEKPNRDIINILNKTGYRVEVIKDRDIQGKNLGKYSFLFIDDGVLRKTSSMNLSMYRLVIMNGNYGEELGLTDGDGISQLASNELLKVKKNNSIIDVYDDSSLKLGGIGVSYYYLAKNNKNNNMKSIASTYAGVGQNIGDVIAYSKQGKNKCFFGIFQTKYWTDETKKLFKQCIMFTTNSAFKCSRDMDCNDNNELTMDTCVYPETIDSYCNHTPIEMNNTVTCVMDSDCGTNMFIGDSFCLNTTVERNFLSFKCNNPDSSESYCSNETTSKDVESCNMCSNGMCSFNETNESLHDIAILENYSHSINGVVIRSLATGNYVGNENLMCNSLYLISYNVINNGNETEDVMFNAGNGLINWTSSKMMIPGSLEKIEKILKFQTQGNYTISVMAMTNSVDKTPMDNMDERKIMVKC